MIKTIEPFDTTVDILIVTYKRLEMFKKCYESFTKNAGFDDYKIYIWDNGSGKEYQNYLKKIQKENPHIAHVEYCKENVGSKAYRELAKISKGEHIVIMDDDVIEFPKNWLSDLLDAFWDAPFPFQIWGMLSANVVRDDKTNGARWSDKEKSLATIGKHRDLKSVNGRNFIVGSTYGAWVAMTHRTTYSKTEGFGSRAFDKETKEPVKFFAIDGQYSLQVAGLQMPCGLYEDLEVYHAAGPWWNWHMGYTDLWEEKAQKTIKESAKEYLEREPTLTAMKDI